LGFDKFSSDKQEDKVGKKEKDKKPKQKEKVKVLIESDQESEKPKIVRDIELFSLNRYIECKHFIHFLEH
jgi:hypothetical protein